MKFKCCIFWIIDRIWSCGFIWWSSYKQKNIPSHPIVVYHLFTWIHYSQYYNNNRQTDLHLFICLTPGTLILCKGYKVLRFMNKEHLKLGAKDEGKVLNIEILKLVTTYRDQGDSWEQGSHLNLMPGMQVQHNVVLINPPPPTQITVHSGGNENFKA